MFPALEGGQLRLLKQEEIQKIHETSLRILEEVGMKVENAEARKIFADHGAMVDEATHIVRMPGKMVEAAVKSAPSKVILYGRDPKNDLHLEKARTHFGTGGTVLYALDLETGEKRQTNTTDVRDIARMVDYCDNVSFYVINTYPQNVPDSASDINRFYWALTNTTKHCMGGLYTKKGLMDIIAMAEELAGGADKLRERPFVSFISMMISPLLMDGGFTDFLMEIVSRGIPIVISTEPLSGATAPVTLAGTIALNNAESLAGITLTQLINPGTPVLYGSTASIMDMKEGTYMAGPIESAMINAGLAQMTQFYGLPMYGTCGMSDSKINDVQAGYESALTSTVVALSGSNYIHDSVGILEMCQVFSYDKMITDNEILGNIARLMKGITVNDDTLAFDVIKSVGPGGHYLAEDHTVAYVRKEFFMPKISDRQTRVKWEESGSLTATDRSRTIVTKILKNHIPKPVDPQMKAKIRARHPEINGEELY